jgi:hypothetical protein
MILDVVFIFSVGKMAITAGVNASVDNICTTGLKCTIKEEKCKNIKLHIRNEETSSRISNGVILVLTE